MTRASAAFLAALALASFATTAFAQPQGVYWNERFRFSVGYPAQTVRPLPEAGNGDGRAFAPISGTADIRVFGGYNAMNRPPDVIAEDAQSECDGHRSAYHLVRPDLVAISCIASGQVIYRKTLIRGDRLITFYARYPVLERDQWDPVVDAMSSSLQAP